MTTTFTVNGEVHSSHRTGMTPLLDVLRDDLSLTGAKVGCREGICGACTVHINDKPACSCLVPVATLEGAHINSIESMVQGGTLSFVQDAIESHDVVQCGMCFPGIVMTLTSFFKTNANPSRDEIKMALVGNICRCTGYERLVEAALSIASGKDAKCQPMP